MIFKNRHCQECNKLCSKVYAFFVDLGGYTKSHYVCQDCLAEAAQELSEARVASNPK